MTCLKITQYFGKYSPTTWGESQDLDQISETMGNSKSQAYDVFPSTSIAIKNYHMNQPQYEVNIS